MASWSSGTLGLSCAAGLGYALYAYLESPAVVPVHFGLGGIPDRWGTPAEVLTVNGCVIGLGSALFFALPEIIRRAPKSTLNLPNKDYWLAPEHRKAAVAKFALWGNAFGTALNLLMITLQLLLGPNRQTQSPVPALVLLAFLLFSVCWCIGLARAFRVPEGADARP